MTMPRIKRGGTYYRVCDPSWKNPADTSWSKRKGGRWNPQGEFGALYLNATIDAAAANARRSIRLEFGNAITFTDLRENQRPQIQSYAVQEHDFVDAVTSAGIAALGLPNTYPAKCGHHRCRQIGQEAYAADETGIACKSAAAPTQEELAIFDSHADIAAPVPRSRKSFSKWYPGFSPPKASKPKSPAKSRSTRRKRRQRRRA